MARDSNGNMTLAKPAFTSGTNIVSADVNSDLSDIATEITDSLSRSGKGGMTAPLRVADGTVGAPTLSFTNETGTGLYREGAGDARMTVGGTAKSKWTSAGFFADVVTALTAVGATIKGAVADGASAVAVIVDNTIALATAGAKIISFRHNAVEKLYIDKDGKIDGPGALGIGNTTGTTLTLGRAAQQVAVGGTLSVATIDNAGTINIGTSAATTITVGRSGQTQTLAGTADIAVLDRAGTIGIGTTSGTTITLSRTNQRITTPGSFDALQALTVTLISGSNWTVNASTTVVGWTAAAISGYAEYTAAAGASFTSIATIQSSRRPSTSINFMGMVLDSGTAQYVAWFNISTAGVLSMTYYDNGTSLVSPFTLAAGDTVYMPFSYTLA
jgi:hypothetical protein